MHCTSVLISLAVVLGAAGAQEYPFPAQFQAWNWDCNASGSHTLGTFIGDKQNECLSLQTDTRGIDVQHLEEGCTLTFFSDALCDPSLGKAYREGPRTGCLWTDTEYKSYTLTCEI